MIKHLKRILILILGTLSLSLGVGGLALPFLPGWPFLILGTLLISICVPQVRVWVEMHTRRYPKLHEMVEKLDSRLRGIIGEV
jgi:uncharacterized membrane protein YbaN (DUF454 family)